jgi:hypothetical protein
VSSFPLSFFRLPHFTRYALLLRELLRHIPPDHADRGPLSDALDQIEEKAAMLNRRKKECEVR